MFEQFFAWEVKFALFSLLAVHQTNKWTMITRIEGLVTIPNCLSIKKLQENIYALSAARYWRIRCKSRKQLIQKGHAKIATKKIFGDIVQFYFLSLTCRLLTFVIQKYASSSRFFAFATSVEIILVNNGKTRTKCETSSNSRHQSKVNIVVLVSL